ncbi:MAG: hypothetical protein IJ094_12145, partial [Bacilli bacterium]|nr:hypothetical protein [Bacilli bacterium]
RVVYNYNKDENMILKVISYLVSNRYDNNYYDNLYSFRRKLSTKDAIKKLANKKEICKLYGYKVDISNYFNSVSVDILLDKMKVFFKDDLVLFNFLKELLVNNNVNINGNIIEETKGIMAGVPISSFLANIYLQDIDEYFYKKQVLYIRYSDDIILFSDKENITKYINKLNELIKINKLKLNKEKIKDINPGEKWEFLGFCYNDGIIDISDIAKKKIKGKIKRSCRKLRRWMIKKNASKERAIAAVIRKFNNKFFCKDETSELTWCLWYFPVINTSKSLKEIDNYMQNSLRYIATGRYTKKNYNLRYEDLKKLGYRSLVNEYYNFKKGRIENE